MTVKGGTTPACAACKHQRRKCIPNCPLATYFPANQPKKFQNVHRLFGVSNVTNVLKRLKTKDQRDDAMKSIIFEADMREQFSVHGCTAVLFQLQLQLEYKTEELRAVYTQLAVCKEQMNKQTECPPPPVQLDFGSSSNNDVAVGRALEFGSSSSNDVPFQSGQYFLNEKNGLYGDNMIRPLTLNNNNNLTEIQEQMDVFGIQQDRNIFTNPAKTMIDSSRFSHFETKETMIDSSHERRSHFETKESFDQSYESPLKDSRRQIDQICQKELRTAAASFNLTTV